MWSNAEIIGVCSIIEDTWETFLEISKASINNFVKQNAFVSHFSGLVNHLKLFTLKAT